MGGGLIIDLDIQAFFDTIDHQYLRAFLQQRVKDGVILRLIGKWLKARMLEAGEWQKNGVGSPQGGVISPMLANVYLHYVLDEWFEKGVKSRLPGLAFEVRFADDAILAFSNEADARKVLEVLPKRFALTLHPSKTQLVWFRLHQEQGAQTFDFLGFTHYWGESWRGYRVIKRKTAKDRLRRGLKLIALWCRANRHSPSMTSTASFAEKFRGLRQLTASSAT